MKSSRLLLFFFLSTLCAAQTVLTTPGGGAPSQAMPDDDQRDAPLPTAPRTRTGSPARSMEQRGSSDSRTEDQENRWNQTTQRPRSSRPLPPRSEFQRLAEDVAGRRLPVFGRQLFEEAPSTFAPMDQVAVPSDYALGPGDELLIRVWGKIDLDARVTIDRNGQIALPRVGTLTVAGLRYAQLEGYLRTSIAAIYRDFELNVTLGQLRSIQIVVLGNARQPGTYTVSSLSTLVNALLVSGGPSANGTMRRIELRRGKSTLTELDLYALLQRADTSHDVQLLPGDIIYIPPVGAQIALTEGVKEPGIYELRGQTTLAEALETAGGLTSLASVDRVLLERFDGRRGRFVEEFELNAAGKQKVLADGDLLHLLPVSPKFANAVTLRGNVARPGRYVWHEGMRVSDLIPSRDSLLTRDYWNQQNHLVASTSDARFARPGTEERTPDLRENDRPDLNDEHSPRREREDPSQDDAMGLRDRQSGNRRETPETTELDRRAGLLEENVQSESAVAGRERVLASVGKNNAEINWEYAVVERLDPRDLSTHLVAFNLGRALDDAASPDNQRLLVGDVVTIFSRSDIALPMEQHAVFVRVGGEIKAPGIYRVAPGETLRQVVERAGGLMPHSYLYAAQLFRVSTRQAQERELKVRQERLQQELVAAFAHAAPGNGNYADQQAQLSLQQTMLTRTAAVQPTGRIVLDIGATAASLGDIPAFPLEDGDSFYIPPRMSTVQVSGSVYNENAFRHQPEKRLMDYVNDAGGASRTADKSRIFVIRADGTVVSRQSHAGLFHGDFNKLALLPGDAVVVPEKIKVNSRMNEFLQASQLASQTALAAAALSVIK